MSTSPRLAASPDGQWLAAWDAREVVLWPAAGGPAAARAPLAEPDAALVFVGPPDVLLLAAAGRVALHTLPELARAAEVEVPGGMRVLATTGLRAVLGARDDGHVRIIRASGRALASLSIELPAPAELAVGLERDQVLFALPRRLEVWDAAVGRPSRRLALPLPPAPRRVGAAAGHIWAIQPGREDVYVYRLSDGRPFHHRVGAPIDDVIAHPASALLVLVTPRGLVRLSCFAHSLALVDDVPPHGALALVVAGEEVALAGLPADGAPWRIVLGGRPRHAPVVPDPEPASEPSIVPPASPAPIAASPGITAAVSTATVATAPSFTATVSTAPTFTAPPHAAPSFIAPPPIASSPVITPAASSSVTLTAADKLRAMRGGHVDASPAAVAPLPSAPLPSAPLPSAPLPSAPLPSAPLPSAPLPSAPLPSAPLPLSPSPPTTWRDALAAWAASLPTSPPALPTDGELHHLCHHLALAPTARAALAALYARYLLGAPALSLAELARLLGDWTEPLGRGQLAQLALVRRARGTIALAAAACDALDGAPPRAIRVAGHGPASPPPPGAFHLPRGGRRDDELEAALAGRLGQIALVHGRTARALLEARLAGVAAIALTPPAAPPHPWPAGACLVVVVDAAAPAWTAALPPLA